jgi:hypothetical protein
VCSAQYGCGLLLVDFVDSRYVAQVLSIIIIIIIISFMHGIYTYTPETNYVPREYSVAVIVLFLFMVHTSPAPVLNLLHFYISTFRSMCAVPNMAVFCSSLTSWIPGTLLRYFLNGFEMVPVAHIILIARLRSDERLRQTSCSSSQANPTYKSENRFVFTASTEQDLAVTIYIYVQGELAVSLRILIPPSFFHDFT